MRKTLVGTATLAAGLMLAACGGATVDSTDVTPSATLAPPTVSTSETTTTTTTSSQSSTAAPAPVAPQPEDQVAHEVDEIPEQQGQYAPEEQDFLTELADKGVSVDTVENQMLNTGYTICDGNTVIRDAVAGQLVEQGRVELDVTEVATLLDDAAHAHLC